MLVRVKGMAQGLHGLHALLAEDVQQQLVAEAQALGMGAVGAGFHGLLQAVHERQEILHEPFQGEFVGLLHVLEGALLDILQLCLGTQRQVLEPGGLVLGFLQAGLLRRLALARRFALV